MIEASSAALSRFGVFVRSFHQRPGTTPSSPSVSIVSAPTPRRFFISRWMASLEARTGLRFRPVSVFSASSPCVAKSRLVATSTVPFRRRNGSNSSLQQNARGKKRKKLPVRLDVFERGISQPIFLSEPAQHIFFSCESRREPKAERSRVNGATSCLPATILSSNSSPMIPDRQARTIMLADGRKNSRALAYFTASQSRSWRFFLSHGKYFAQIVPELFPGLACLALRASTKFAIAALHLGSRLCHQWLFAKLVTSGVGSPPGKLPPRDHHVGHRDH